MPVISTLGGEVPYAAGKGMGQILAEKDAFSQGMQRAQLSMEQQRLNDAKKAAKLSRIYQQERTQIENLRYIQEQERLKEEREYNRIFKERGYQTEQDWKEREYILDLEEVAQKREKTEREIREAQEEARTSSLEYMVGQVLPREQQFITERMAAVSREAIPEPFRGALPPGAYEVPVRPYPRELTMPEKISRLREIGMEVELGEKPTITPIKEPTALKTAERIKVKIARDIPLTAGEQRVYDETIKKKEEDLVVFQRKERLKYALKSEERILDLFETGYAGDPSLLDKRFTTEEKNETGSALEQYNKIRRRKGLPELEFVKVKAGVWGRIGDYWELVEKGTSSDKTKGNRFDELIASGLSEEQAYRKLVEEGF